MNKTNKEADMVTVYFGVFGFITLLGVALIVFRHRLADQKLFIFNGDDLDD